MKNVEQEGGRSPRKQEKRILQLAVNQLSVHLNTRPSLGLECDVSSEQDNTNDKLVVSPATTVTTHDTRILQY